VRSAVRVIRTCRELQIATVAVYSELDSNSLHVRLADEAYALGGQAAAESYLMSGAILDVLARSGADAGASRYGFPRRERGVRPSGRRPPVRPSSDRPRVPSKTMGDKISARLAAERAGVASVPGRNEPITDPAEVIAFGESNGWAGSRSRRRSAAGGRGMRVVTDASDAASAMESAPA